MEDRTVKVTVHRDRCISSGQCVFNAPEVFDQSDVDGCVELRQAEPPTATIEAVRDAADLCPTRAIEILQG
jgi:ferredoxin